MESHFKIVPIDGWTPDVHEMLLKQVLSYYYTWNTLPPKGLVINGYELVLVEIVDKDYFFKFEEKH